MSSKRLFLSLLVFLLTSGSMLYAQDQPGEGVWANYDFVPGDTVLFYADFSGAYVGDFPVDRLEYINGNMEVVERDGNRLLRTLNEGTFRIMLPDSLPHRFTVEFDVEGTDARHTLYMWSKEGQHLDKAHIHAVVTPQGSGLTVGKYNEGPKATVASGEATIAQKATVRISAEGDYMKMYINEKRVSNVPKAPLLRTTGLSFELGVYPHDDEALYIDNIRVAQGGRIKMYDRIMQDGKVITQGIYFDTGSATLRPESTPTLKEILRMMQDHSDLTIRIEGHTDNTGSDDVNQPLSEDRAESVRQYLIDQGIAADRLQAQGLGASRPLAENDTAEGRQQNRRVELWRVTDGE